MKSISFRLAMLLIATLSIPSAGSAQYFTSGGLGYQVLSAEDHTVEVTVGDCFSYYQGNISIPPTVEYNGVTYDVVALGEEAFYRASLTGITIPSSVTEIKGSCFLFASLPATIAIPASVSNIGPLAFAANNLTSINVDEASPYFRTIDGMLLNKDTATLVECPIGKSGTVTLPQGTRHISKYAFAYCHNITGIVLPEGLYSIGFWAFVDNRSLNNVVIPASVTHIAPGPFVACPALNSLSIAAGNTHYYMDGMMIYSAGGDTLVSAHKSADSVYLPGTLRFVDGFGGNSDIRYVHVPEGVATIGTEAFNGSTLESIDLPSQMELIDEYAFYGCASLSRVGMPSVLNRIGEGCFNQCSNLESIDIPNGLHTIPNGTFFFCTSLSHISWGDAVETIGEFAFGDCAFTELQLPATLRTVKQGAFVGEYGSRLRRVEFTAPVDTIEQEAFYRHNLQSIRLKNSLPPITDAEYGCLYMTSVDSIIIPCGSIDNYLNDSYWGQFADKYHEDCNGIGDICTTDIMVYSQEGRIVVKGAGNEKIMVFDIAGRPVENRALRTGIYLVQVGDRPARKVAVIR